MNAPPPVAPVVDERVVIVSLLVGMAFLAATCVVVGVVALVPKAWRLVQERRAEEAALDAEVFTAAAYARAFPASPGDRDPLAAARAEFADFALWDAEMGADR